MYLDLRYLINVYFYCFSSYVAELVLLITVRAGLLLSVVLATHVVNKDSVLLSVCVCVRE